MNLYCELSLEEGIQLGDFVERIKADEFGARERDEIIAFLRQLEDEMLLNIESRIEESPHLESDRDRRTLRVHERIQKLVGEL